MRRTEIHPLGASKRRRYTRTDSEDHRSARPILYRAFISRPGLLSSLTESDIGKDHGYLMNGLAQGTPILVSNMSPLASQFT